MELEILRDRLNNASLQSLDARLYFITKQRNNDYHAYSPRISPEIMNELKKILDQAIKNVIDVEQREFSPIGSIEGTVEVCSTSSIGSYRNIISCLEEDIVERSNISGHEISKLNFYCFRLYIDEEEIIFFRRLNRLSKIKKKGFFGRLTNEFNMVETDELIGIDDGADLIVFRDEILILNHISMERIFSMTNEYSSHANITLNRIENTNIVHNFTQFRDDCLSNGRVTRILTKLLSEEDLMNDVLVNFDKIKDVISDFELNIGISEETNQIIYQDRSELLEILRILRDSFYTSAITSRSGIDERI